MGQRQSLIPLTRIGLREPETIPLSDLPARARQQVADTRPPWKKAAGDALIAAIDAGLGFFGVGPESSANQWGQLIAAGIPVVGGAKAIRAFHGSPHDFDQFSLAKIGTGEGAQAYGHGLYFAENEGVARNYRDALGGGIQIGDRNIPLGVQMNTNTAEGLAANTLAAHNFDFDSALGSLAGKSSERRPLDGARWLLEQWKKDGITPKEANSGRMYEVNINADPEDFLDWDAPLSQQPKVAQKLGLPQRPNDNEIDALIARLRAEVGPERLAQHPDFKAMEARLDATRHLEQPGESAYRDWQRAGSDAGRESFRKGGISSGPEAATNYLKERGIPGIKYLDGASRGKGEGSRNYVVFDDKLISIVKKYGMAGALGAGLINEGQARQLQAQGY